MQILHKTKAMSVINLWDKCHIVYSLENKAEHEVKKKSENNEGTLHLPGGKRNARLSIKAGYLSFSL